MTFSVQSEAGQLRQVIVHRPGLELSRLTPRNVGELLFDDVLWAKKAKEEHDAFAEVLREKGVRVHYFGQLLGETLELPEGRAFVLDRLCTPEMLGPNLITPLRQLFDDLRKLKFAHRRLLTRLCRRQDRKILAEAFVFHERLAQLTTTLDHLDQIEDDPLLDA